MIEFYEDNIKKCEIALERAEDESKRKDIEWLLENYKEKLEKEKIYAKRRVEEQQIIGSALRKHEQEAIARGEIIDPFIKQHLQAKIKTARWALALGIAMTCLFKGQWAIWIVMIIIYFIYVNSEKDKAKKAEEKKRNK